MKSQPSNFLIQQFLFRANLRKNLHSMVKPFGLDIMNYFLKSTLFLYSIIIDVEYFSCHCVMAFIFPQEASDWICCVLIIQKQLSFDFSEIRELFSVHFRVVVNITCCPSQ